MVRICVPLQVHVLGFNVQGNHIKGESFWEEGKSLLLALLSGVRILTSEVEGTVLVSATV